MVRPIDALAQQWPPLDIMMENYIRRLIMFCERDEFNYLSLHVLKRVYKTLKKSETLDWDDECKWLVSTFIDPSLENGNPPTIRHGPDCDNLMRLYGHALHQDPALSKEGPLLASAIEDLEMSQQEEVKAQAKAAQAAQQDLPFRLRSQHEQSKIQAQKAQAGQRDLPFRHRPQHDARPEHSGPPTLGGKPRPRPAQPLYSLDKSRRIAPPMTKQNYKQPFAEPETSPAGGGGIQIGSYGQADASPSTSGLRESESLKSDSPPHEHGPMSAYMDPQSAGAATASSTKAVAGEPIGHIKVESVDEKDQEPTVVIQAVLKINGQQTIIPFSPENFDEEWSNINAYLDWKRTDGKNSPVNFDTFMSIRCAVAPLSTAVIRRHYVSS